MASQSSPHSTSTVALGCSSPNEWKLRKNIVRSAQGANEMHSRRHSGKFKDNIESISLLNLFVFSIDFRRCHVTESKPNKANTSVEWIYTIRFTKQ